LLLKYIIILSEHRKLKLRTFNNLFFAV